MLRKLEREVDQPMTSGVFDVHPELRPTPSVLTPPIATFELERVLPSSESFTPPAVSKLVEVANKDLNNARVVEVAFDLFPVLLNVIVFHALTTSVMMVSV
jgi:hypothetical protein